MLAVVRSPLLVGRDEELAALEEALLETSLGEGRFVLIAGEAGQGKTRLTEELAARARKLGFTTLAGGAAEAEFALPYLPFVQALGNWLAGQDAVELSRRLGPAASDLARLLPQVAPGGAAAPSPGDPAQEKLRLFEAVAAVLSLTAGSQGLLLVIEDVHWADAATRELLDYLSRRAPSLRLLLVATYRSDELDRRHPLTRTVQAWRRSGQAQEIRVGPLTSDEVGRMIGGILGSGEEVSEEFRTLLHDRTEGNPFVLEEMLKEAIERGDLYRVDDRWERKEIQELRIPDTVRDAILLRLERLDPAHVAVLQAAALLGRTFDHATLAAVAYVGDGVVRSAIEAGVAGQLIEEVSGPSMPGPTQPALRWRHALTQEAIVTDMVLPHRQELHSRAADILADGPAPPLGDVARHLLEAGRFAEAVPACLRAAEEAERATAFAEAVSLYERAHTHCTDPVERARIACLIGRNLWIDAREGQAERWLRRGVEELEALGEQVEAARFRLVLGRTRWELSQPDLALRDYESARATLEAEGPSAELALAYMRIAGLHLFELDDARALGAAQRAVEIATQAGADHERVWSESFLAVALFGSGRVEEGLERMDRVASEAIRKGYWYIAQNVLFNEIWTRTHAMLGDLDSRLERLSALRDIVVVSLAFDGARAYVSLATGDLETALALSREAVALARRNEIPKTEWRARIVLVEALTEMGETEAALAELPAPTSRVELQDLVYDSAARIHLMLAVGREAEAVVQAEEIISSADRLRTYRETLALAVEALVAVRRLDDARALIAVGRDAPTPAGTGYLDVAEGRVFLAAGDPTAAVPHLRRAVGAAAEVAYLLWELRASALLGEALMRAGETAEGERVLRDTAARSAGAGANLIRSQTEAVAKGLGLRIEPAAPRRRAPAEEPVPVAERMVTSLFADVRGYTRVSASLPPAELASRMTDLYTWAKREIEGHGGIVDKFAGDAVMATFNVSGERVDHALAALRAALALRDKATLLDLELGIGIAVGPAVVGSLVPGANVSVLGSTTNLAARLQAAAAGGEILLSDEAHRRVGAWLAERGLPQEMDRLTLKGFDEPQVTHRIRPPLARSVTP